jgi:hypothetical protein
MRIDEAEQINLFGITTRLNVWTSIFVFVAALTVFVLLGRKGRPEPDTPYLPGRGPVRDADTPVSDSESRDTLPVIQNGSGNSSTPTEEQPASGDGDKSIPVKSETGSSGHKATESAPEAGTSK